MSVKTFWTTIYLRDFSRCPRAEARRPQAARMGRQRCAAVPAPWQRLRKGSQKGHNHKALAAAPTRWKQTKYTGWDPVFTKDGRSRTVNPKGPKAHLSVLGSGRPARRAHGRRAQAWLLPAVPAHKASPASALSKGTHFPSSEAIEGTKKGTEFGGLFIYFSSQKSNNSLWASGAI